MFGLALTVAVLFWDSKSQWRIQGVRTPQNTSALACLLFQFTDFHSFETKILQLKDRNMTKYIWLF